MKPTDEQIKEFWVKYGFKLIPRYGGTNMDNPLWRYPDGDANEKSPPIDLNNLFKWVVPTLNDAQKARLPGIFSDGGKKFEFHWFWEDPALALFWALWKVKR